MRVTIEPLRRSADPTQVSELNKLFTHQGYIILREMIASRCAEAQIKAATGMVYPGNEDAEAQKKHYTEEAIKLNSFLDFLDDFQEKPDEWFTMKIEIRR